MRLFALSNSDSFGKKVAASLDRSLDLHEERNFEEGEHKELSALALECDILESPGTGQLFLNVYRWKSKDKIPDLLIQFYKAKRAFLRARLSISHLLEEKYLAEDTKWRNRCEAYLKAAHAYCEHLPKKC